jgi:hypothetical protein
MNIGPSLQKLCVCLNVVSCQKLLTGEVGGGGGGLKPYPVPYGVVTESVSYKKLREGLGR